MAVRTLKDHIEAAGGVEALIAASDPLTSRIVVENGAVYFVCRCKRRVLADMMVDLENPAVEVTARVATAVRAARARAVPPGEDSRRFVCDGCWTFWVRTGVVGRDDFRAAIGAPPLPAGSRSRW